MSSRAETTVTTPIGRDPSSMRDDPAARPESVPQTGMDTGLETTNSQNAAVDPRVGENVTAAPRFGSIRIRDFGQYLPAFKQGNNYGADWRTPWIKLPSRVTSSHAWLSASLAQRGFLVSVLQLYADRCVRVSRDGYHWSESGLEGDPAALRSAVGVPRDRYVGDHLHYWIKAGLLSIAESGQNRGLDLTSPEGQRTEWPGGDVTGEDTALDHDPDEAFGLFFPAEEGNSELERPVDQRPRIAPAQRF